MTQPAPDGRVDAKVWAATGASAAAAAVLVVLNALQDQPQLVAGLPVWAQSVVTLLALTLAPFIAGYVKSSQRT